MTIKFEGLKIKRYNNLYCVLPFKNLQYISTEFTQKYFIKNLILTSKNISLQ